MGPGQTRLVQVFKLIYGKAVVFELIIKRDTFISRSFETRSGAKTQRNVLRKARQLIFHVEEAIA